MWVNLFHILPVRLYTFLVGIVASIRVPRFVRARLWKSLAETMGINLAEAELPVEHYPCFRDLFTRRLMANARQIDRDLGSIVSPVDACVSAMGHADGMSVIQAKGIQYSMETLLGDTLLARRLSGGMFMTLYLRPKDYHRVHAPFAGDLRQTRRIPGTLFPVQPAFVRHLNGLFVRNERMVFDFENKQIGRWSLVCVGAAAVGAIKCPIPDTDGALKQFAEPVAIDKGQELALFSLGSTAIILFEAGRVQLQRFENGEDVRMGQALGTICNNTSDRG